MHFKLPSIHHLVNSNKKIPDNNPSKYVHVLNGFAIVSYNIIAAVKLNEYIKRECDVEDEDDLKEMYQILDWMEGKSFTKEVWQNFVKEQMVYIEEDGVRIEDPSFKKIIVYESPELDLGYSLKSVADNVDLEDSMLSRLTFNGSHLDLLQKAFKNELKKDHINFEFSGAGKPVKFALEERNFIFGSLTSTLHGAQNIIAFLENKDLKEFLHDHIDSLPPPPPFADELEDFDSELEKSDALEGPGLFE